MPSRSVNRQGRRWLPWAVGALGIVLTISAYQLLENVAARNLALRAEDEASTRTAALDRALANMISVVKSGKALFDASDDVTRQEFARISQALAAGVPGLRAFCFIRRVTDDQREAFERAKRNEGLTSFSIRDYTKDGTLVPATRRNEHFPIDYLEPAPSADVFGYDLAGSPRRLAPLQAAADHNRITSDVSRALFSDGRLGFAIVAPIYDVPDPPVEVPARRRLLRGFVGALVELAPFVDVSLPPDRPTQVVDTYILDEHDTVLYARESSGAAEHLSTPAAIRASAQTLRTVDIADHRWTLAFRSHLTSSAGGRTARLMVLMLGLALTTFVVLYTRRLQYSEGRLEALVEARTRDLRLTHEQLQQAQKMEAVGRLTGGIAHDFNNLLTVVMGNIALARESVADEQVVSSMLDPALQAAERGADLTRRLLAFSRRQTLRPSVVHLPELVESLRPLVARTLGETVTLEVKSNDEVWPVLADASQIETALVNLCLNARDAMPGGGRIAVSMENAVLSAPSAANPDVVPGDYVVIDVKDSGVGMTDDVREKAFEPFFTTKPIGKGSGLGLSMVFGFVKQSNGHVTLMSAPGHGTTVRMFFPRARLQS